MLLKLVALQFIIGSILCYHVVLERAMNIFVNEKYLKYANFYVKRYSRRSPYYLNIEGETMQTWDNNVTLIIDLNEKLSNMYKPTFVNFRIRICDLITKDHIFGTMLRKIGFKCPVPRGEYKLQNLTIVMEDFPNVFPFENGRADVSGEITATKEVVYKGYVYFQLVRSKTNDTKAVRN